MTVPATGRLVPIFQLLAGLLRRETQTLPINPVGDMPPDLLRDVGLESPQPADSRQDAFWRQSRRLGHRSLPF
ncbi:hypothetical protein [Ciceribacter sp. RN22]|uniref:hypothetical protein n=1 Tax=Ciceribacter sp. RN22 TaxID=2954932 RepID=UPI002093CC3D|nr:hypothetical protein [Ciceribacter sp. RN22]MCO6179002.1 hypothetical protein [Ciceribacter sp. RN22]